MLSELRFSKLFVRTGLLEQADLESLDPDLRARNSYLNSLYMILFGVQICLLYLRFSSILSRTRTFGPLVRMAISMIQDIFKFLFVAIPMLSGFVFAMSFIIGTDKSSLIGTDSTTGTERDLCLEPDQEPTATLQSTPQSIALYMFQVLLGQHDWAETNSNECLSDVRSRLVGAFIIMFSFMGSVLSVYPLYSGILNLEACE